MQYTRSFKLQSAHFNGEQTYKNYYKLLDGSTNFNLFNDVLADCHGHDFRVVVKAIGQPDERGILVLDEDIEKQVKRWDRTNISVLPEYVEKRRRATTEAMAEDLLERLSVLYPRVHFIVEVWETEEICATAQH